MPDGNIEYFTSWKEYEDAYYDALFDCNNTFQVEVPEPW